VFAERLGVTRGAVSRWINGSGRPSGALAEKVERLTAGAIMATTSAGPRVAAGSRPGTERGCREGPLLVAAQRRLAFR
jgi:transcriptional regulator with XRE-family HTH domain